MWSFSDYLVQRAVQTFKAQDLVVVANKRKIPSGEGERTTSSKAPPLSGDFTAAWARAARPKSTPLEGAKSDLPPGSGSPEREKEAEVKDPKKMLLCSIQEASAAHSTNVQRLLRLHLERYGPDLEAAQEEINKMVANGVVNGIRGSTDSAYASASGSWEFFCDLFSKTQYPASEVDLMHFVAWSSNRCNVASSKQYLTGIRNAQLARGLPWVERDEMPLLKRLLKGMEWLEAAQQEGRLRLPITVDVLQDLLVAKWKKHQELKELGKEPSIYSMENFYLAAAVYCTGLCGLLRPSEFTVRTTGKKTMSNPLQRKHLFLRHGLDGGALGASLSIPKRKTDQLGERSLVELGLTGDQMVCAATWLEKLLALRKEGGEEADSPEALLFAVSTDGGQTLKPVTYEILRAAMDQDLAAVGRANARYQGHSFRIGGATSLRRNGVPDSIIEDMGGWVRGSLSLPRYIAEMSSEGTRRDMAQYFLKR